MGVTDDDGELAGTHRHLLMGTHFAALSLKPTMKTASTKPDWQAIEKAAISGVPYPTLAKQFKVSLAAVKKQASRSKWAVPARIKRRARELSPRVTEDEAVTVAAQSLLADGRAATVHGMKILRGKLAKAAARPSSIADLETVSDVATALRGARLAAGLDRVEGAQVQVNLAMFQGQEGPEGGPVWDCDEVEA